MYKLLSIIKNLSCASIFVLSGSLHAFNPNSKSEDLFKECIKLVEDVDARVAIQDSFDNKKESVLMIQKDRYVFIEFDPEHVNYISSKLGSFSGRFEKNLQNKLVKFFTPLRKASFLDSDYNIIFSVRDGMGVFVSSPNGLVCISDIIVLQIFEDESYSPALKTAIDHFLEFIYELSKFDLVVKDYVEGSLNDKNLVCEDYSYEKLLRKIEEFRTKRNDPP